MPIPQAISRFTDDLEFQSDYGLELFSRIARDQPRTRQRMRDMGVIPLALLLVRKAPTNVIYFNARDAM